MVRLFSFGIKVCPDDFGEVLKAFAAILVAFASLQSAPKAVHDVTRDRDHPITKIFPGTKRQRDSFALPVNIREVNARVESNENLFFHAQSFMPFW